MAEQEKAGAVEVTMSTGVVFRLTAASQWALTDVNRQVNADTPEPPKVFITDQDRYEVNEADPDYVEAVTRHYLHRLERLYEVMIATGTEVVSVPDGFPTHDGDWRDGLLAVGVKLSAEPSRRYVEWVKFKAAPAEEDWQVLNSTLLRRAGTTEADVAQAMEAFRRLPERPADPVPEPEG